MPLSIADSLNVRSRRTTVAGEAMRPSAAVLRSATGGALSPPRLRRVEGKHVESAADLGRLRRDAELLSDAPVRTRSDTASASVAPGAEPRPESSEKKTRFAVVEPAPSDEAASDASLKRRGRARSGTVAPGSGGGGAVGGRTSRTSALRVDRFRVARTVGRFTDRLLKSKCARVLAKDPASRTERDLERVAEYLADNDFFAKATPSVRRQMCSAVLMERRRAGYVLFRLGDAGDKFYVVFSGKVGVYVDRAPSDDGKTAKPVSLREAAKSNLMEEGVTIGESRPASPVSDFALAKPDSPATVDAPPEGSSPRASAGFDPSDRSGEWANRDCVVELGPGASFGELALLNSEPRSATIRVHEAAELITLRREDYNAILRIVHEEEVNKRIDFLRSCPIFQHQARSVVAKMAACFQDVHFAPKDVVVAQGAEGLDDSFMFFIADGQAKVTFDGPARVHRAQVAKTGTQGRANQFMRKAVPRRTFELALLGARQHFGGVAILDHARQPFTVTAVTALHCLRVSRVNLVRKFVPSDVNAIRKEEQLQRETWWAKIRRLRALTGEGDVDDEKESARRHLEKSQSRMMLQMLQNAGDDDMAAGGGGGPGAGGGEKDGALGDDPGEKGALLPGLAGRPTRGRLRTPPAARRRRRPPKAKASERDAPPPDARSAALMAESAKRSKAAVLRSTGIPHGVDAILDTLRRFAKSPETPVRPVRRQRTVGHPKQFGPKRLGELDRDDWFPSELPEFRDASPPPTPDPLQVLIGQSTRALSEDEADELLFRDRAVEQAARDASGRRQPSTSPHRRSASQPDKGPDAFDPVPAHLRDAANRVSFDDFEAAARTRAQTSHQNARKPWSTTYTSSTAQSLPSTPAPPSSARSNAGMTPRDALRLAENYMMMPPAVLASMGDASRVKESGGWGGRTSRSFARTREIDWASQHGSDGAPVMPLIAVQLASSKFARAIPASPRTKSRPGGRFFGRAYDGQSPAELGVAQW